MEFNVHKLITTILTTFFKFNNVRKIYLNLLDEMMAAEKSLTTCVCSFKESSSKQYYLQRFSDCSVDIGFGNLLIISRKSNLSQLMVFIYHLNSSYLK